MVFEKGVYEVRSEVVEVGNGIEIMGVEVESV